MHAGGLDTASARGRGEIPETRIAGHAETAIAVIYLSGSTTCLETCRLMVAWESTDQTVAWGGWQVRGSCRPI